MDTTTRGPTGRVLWGIAAAAVLTTTASTTAAAHRGGGDSERGGRRPDPPGQLVDLQLLAFNDYHGHLEPDAAFDEDGDPLADGTVELADGSFVPAGGSEYLATHLARLRRGASNSLTVAAGDLVGGSPFLSGLFHDEPSVESLNALGLDVSSVGNHEFDEGVQELLRLQNGGCHREGCYFRKPYQGANFQWLAANVIGPDGETPLPPYWIEKVQGINVGFIGMTLEGTPTLVAQSGIQGYEFLDEAETANALVPVLKAQGVETIVVLLHEGATQTGGTYDQCEGISGPVIAIHRNLDPEIDALITGHTHQPYNCALEDPSGALRPVTSAYSFGRIISEINLVLDRRTGDVRRELVTSTNHVVTRDVRPDRRQTSIIDRWSALADVIGNQPVGTIAESITRRGDRQLESALANLIADAQLEATRAAPNNAQIALMNPGGVRADLVFNSPDGTAGEVTYQEAFDVQPFGNLLSTIPMSGEQIIDVLEEQCQPPGSSRPFLFLGVSRGLTYDLDRTIIETIDDEGEPLNVCTAVSVTNVRFNGAPLGLDATYQVTVNNFLVDGGDNFTTFADVDPSRRIGAGVDLDAFIDYLAEFSPVSSPGIDRVRELFDE